MDLLGDGLRYASFGFESFGFRELATPVGVGHEFGFRVTMAYARVCVGIGAVVDTGQTSTRDVVEFSERIFGCNFGGKHLRLRPCFRNFVNLFLHFGYYLLVYPHETPLVFIRIETPH